LDVFSSEKSTYTNAQLAGMVWASIDEISRIKCNVYSIFNDLIQETVELIQDAVNELELNLNEEQNEFGLEVIKKIKGLIIMLKKAQKTTKEYNTRESDYQSVDHITVIHDLTQVIKRLSETVDDVVISVMEEEVADLTIFQECVAMLTDLLLKYDSDSEEWYSKLLSRLQL
jgi:hypothetical protein